MKLVVDTNVVVSGIFFSGPPYQILNAWRHGKIKLVLSPEIFSEYQRVAEKLSNQFEEVDLSAWLELLLANSSIVESAPLKESVCEDPDDDKFLACALASDATFIISGDKHLLDISGYRGVAVIRPRSFVDKYLKQNN